MDQCEDREEGFPPSKSTLCGEHESQTKAQRINGRPAGPDPGPSCVSLQSDRSKDEPYNFKVQPVSDVDRLTEVHKKMMMEEEEDRAESAGSSCPSVRSDRSKDENPDFSGEPGPTRGQRSQSAGSSCPSVRSDRSKRDPPFFSDEPGPTSVRGHKESHRRPNPAVDSTAVCAGVPATERLFNLVQSVKGPTHERHTLDLVLSGGLTLCDTEIDNINSLTTCL